MSESEGDGENDGEGKGEGATDTRAGVRVTGYMITLCHAQMIDP